MNYRSIWVCRKVNKLYLVLEYCKKGDLMNILNGDTRTVTCDPMNDTDVWYIMRQVNHRKKKQPTWRKQARGHIPHVACVRRQGGGGRAHLSCVFLVCDKSVMCFRCLLLLGHRTRVEMQYATKQRMGSRLNTNMLGTKRSRDRVEFWADLIPSCTWCSVSRSPATHRGGVGQQAMRDSNGIYMRVPACSKSD